MVPPGAASALWSSRAVRWSYRYDVDGTSLRVWVDLEGAAKRKAEEASQRLNAVVTLYKMTDGVEKQVGVFKPLRKSALR